MSNEAHESRLIEKERANRRRRTRVVIIITSIVLVLGAAGGAAWYYFGSQPTSAPTEANSTVDTLLQTGINQANNGQIETAIGTFQNVLSVDPTSVLANYNLGVIAQGQQQSSQALSYYNAALASNSNFTPAMYNKAILLEASDVEAAITLYKQIVGINPDAATSYFRLGNLYASQGQADLAAEAKAKALALDPTLTNG